VKLAVDIVVPWNEEEPLRLDRKALRQSAHELGRSLVLCGLAGECDVSAYQHEAERPVLLGPDSSVLQQSLAGHILGEAVPAAPEMKVRDVQPGEPVDQGIFPRSVFLMVAVIMRVGSATGLVVRLPGSVTRSCAASRAPFASTTQTIASIDASRTLAKDDGASALPGRSGRLLMMRSRRWCRRPGSFGHEAAATVGRARS